MITIQEALEAVRRAAPEELQEACNTLDAAKAAGVDAVIASDMACILYCRKIGLQCTGIGSHVALYYWPSALIREFIAIHVEKKHAVLFVAGWLLCIAALFIPLMH